EIGDMAFDLAAERNLRRILEKRMGVNVHVAHSSAVPAYEMIVGSGVAVKTVGAAAGGDLLDFAQFRQQGEIAVYSSQADVRKLFADIQIDRVGGGVVRAAR